MSLHRLLDRLERAAIALLGEKPHKVRQRLHFARRRNQARRSSQSGQHELYAARMALDAASPLLTGTRSLTWPTWWLPTAKNLAH
jgi:hypothetical protein